MTRVAEAVATVVEIVDRRLTVTADGDADIYLDTPDYDPLAASEVHATLRVTGDDYHARIDLDAGELDALADAVYHAQETQETLDR